MTPAHFEALYPEDSREEELKKLLQFVKEGNSAQLIGLPGVGRANILGFLAYNKAVREHHLGHLAQWFHFVLVNFTEVRNKPLSEVTKLFFLELSDSLRERGMIEESEKVAEMFKEHLSFQDDLVLFQGLKKAVDYLSIEKELTIIFLFERFETYIPMLTDEFFSNLRILRNKAKYRFSVIFSLTRPLEDLIEPLLLSDFYEFLAGHSVYLSLYDKPGLSFRLEYLAKVSGKEIASSLVEKVLSFTKGHGKLTKIGVEKALLLDKTAKDVTPEWLLSQISIQGALFEIWNFLSTQEQTQLISEHPHSEFLENVHLLEQGSITIPLFKTYVDEQAKKELAAPFVYNAETNTISKGTQMVSDNLTKAEFRLLKLLLTHKDSVVEREDIITAVWDASASTAGVTDQALDQLIFRLRKKIEKDPNVPFYIQTIKGRGVKFSDTI
ncbi:MAG TPA: helix-turn-helix domain-containing protein [Patescibacteria group bacterium]|nr:helix-turn-helix domain-containing protein [Patescibacteria group bacterium]